VYGKARVSLLPNALIGDIYIHGIMRGEAFQEEKFYEMLIS
jgi:hypothetical protein